jgi:ribonuclease P protein component
MNNCFGKKYKLCGEKQIQAVFDSKKSVKQYPLVIHYSELPIKTDVPFQITVSAPKRNFKKAHDRNRIKRLLRESIRQNKLILESFLKTNNKQLALFMIYIAREEIPFDVLQKKMKLVLNQIINEISHETEK